MFPHKRKNQKQSKKLVNFFEMPGSEGDLLQNGGGDAISMGTSSYTDLPDDNPGPQISDTHQGQTPSSPLHSPSSLSPAKTKRRINDAAQLQLSDMAAVSQDLAGPSTESSIYNYPTSGLPVMDTTMKEMLISLQTSLMSNLSVMMNNFSIELKGLNDKVFNVEHKLEDQVRLLVTLLRRIRIKWKKICGSELNSWTWKTAQGGAM